MLFLYFPVLIFMLLSIFISILIFLISYIIIKPNLDIEKISTYECGFEPFKDARNKIDVRFYLIAILFIIFDLEIAYLFPWALDFYYLGNDSLISIMFFLFILTLGFIFEWKKGALDWE